MSPRAIKFTAIALLVVVAVAAAAGIAYFLQQRKIDQLQSELLRQKSETSKQLLKTEALTAQIEQLTGSVPPTSASPESAAPNTEAPATKTEPKPETTPESTEQLAFVTEVADNGGRIRLSLDYAQFLTGDAAARAAADAGDESPPPNDYYILNTTTKVRVLPVAAGAKFTVALFSPDSTTVLTAKQFADAIANNTDGAADAPYWFTVKSGVVTGGKEQWTP